MKRMLCWWDGFSQTWLDPSMWGLHLGGTSVEVDGHTYDFDTKRWEIQGDREVEYMTCVRCGQEVEQGWRSAWN